MDWWCTLASWCWRSAPPFAACCVATWPGSARPYAACSLAASSMHACREGLARMRDRRSRWRPLGWLIGDDLEWRPVPLRATCVRAWMHDRETHCCTVQTLQVSCLCMHADPFIHAWRAWFVGDRTFVRRPHLRRRSAEQSMDAYLPTCRHEFELHWTAMWTPRRRRSILAYQSAPPLCSSASSYRRSGRLWPVATHTLMIP